MQQHSGRSPRPDPRGEHPGSPPGLRFRRDALCSPLVPSSSPHGYWVPETQPRTGNAGPPTPAEAEALVLPRDSPSFPTCRRPHRVTRCHARGRRLWDASGEPWRILLLATLRRHNHPWGSSSGTWAAWLLGRGRWCVRHPSPGPRERPPRLVHTALVPDRPHGRGSAGARTQRHTLRDESSPRRCVSGRSRVEKHGPAEGQRERLLDPRGPAVLERRRFDGLERAREVETGLAALNAFPERNRSQEPSSGAASCVRVDKAHGVPCVPAVC